jgi:hypothetical protein
MLGRNDAVVKMESERASGAVFGPSSEALRGMQRRPSVGGTLYFT